MNTKKRGSAFFEAEKFAQRLEELVDTLPSDADKLRAISQLETLIGFLSDLKTRLESIPSLQDAGAARIAIEKLRELFVEATSNPTLGAALGVEVSEPRKKQPTITSEEIERAKSAIARFDSLSIDEIRAALERMSVRELQSVANALGVRATQRTARDTLVHQVATKITNTRGYRSLRDGTNQP